MNAAFTARTKPSTGDSKTSFIAYDHLGWLKCDARALDKIAYNLPYQVIGYAVGGSGNSCYIPDLQGRVMGSVGTVTDDNKTSEVYTAGQSIGEITHQLILSEIPSHNHDNNIPAVGNSILPGNTSTSTTGITHNGTGPTAGGGGSGDGYGLTYQDGNSTQNGSVNTGNEPNLYTSITPLVLTDSGHFHQVSPNGGDQYHNNIQPTLFYGNTYIYSGIPMIGSFPFTIGNNPQLI